MTKNPGTEPVHAVYEEVPTCPEETPCSWGHSVRLGKFFLKNINRACPVHAKGEAIHGGHRIQLSA
jgi:hypothetical protein